MEIQGKPNGMSEILLLERSFQLEIDRVYMEFKGILQVLVLFKLPRNHEKKQARQASSLKYTVRCHYAIAENAIILSV